MNDGKNVCSDRKDIAEPFEMQYMTKENFGHFKKLQQKKMKHTDDIKLKVEYMFTSMSLRKCVIKANNRNFHILVDG